MMDRVAAITLAGVLGLSGLALAATLPLHDNSGASAPVPSPGETTASLPAISTAQWDALPQAEGDWNWRGGAGSGDTYAEFDSADGENLVHLRCEPDNGELVLSLASDNLASDAVTIHTETQSRVLAADAGESSLSTRIDREDDLLDAMAFSRGRIAFEVEGDIAFAVPAYPEITRVIEDCR